MRQMHALCSFCLALLALPPIACVSHADSLAPSVDEDIDTIGADLVVGNTYRMVAIHSLQLVDVARGSTKDGAAIVQLPSSGLNSQNWRLDKIAGGRYQLVNQKSSSCLSVRGASTADAAPVEQAACTRENQQLWKLHWLGSNYRYQLKNIKSGKCLDVDGASTDQGARLLQWPCGEKDNQAFRFERVRGAEPQPDAGTGGDTGQGGGDAPNHPAYEFFDDFSYESRSDANLSRLGWSIRDDGGEPGGPGVGAFSSSQVTFVIDPDDSRNRLLRLNATTNGTRAGTYESEILTPKKFLYGSYGARVKFSNAPSSGAPDGDKIVQTFFTIHWDPTNPNYSECDFEYMPNGGWGKTDNHWMWFTTWETAEPVDNNSSQVQTDYAGWHVLVAQIANGQVKYYIDGSLKATHEGKGYPESKMNIEFNHWFDTLLSSASPRVYTEDVDWVYHAKDVVLGPSEVEEMVANHRAQGHMRLDSVP